LSTDIASIRFVEIQEQFNHIKNISNTTGFASSSPFQRLINDIEERISKAEQQKRNLSKLMDQDATERQIRNLYSPYLNQLDDIQSRIEDAQQALLYQSLHQKQRENYASRLEYTQQLCEEVNAIFSVNAEYLPVVWDSYASFDILPTEFYAVHIPRDEWRVENSPIIGHELGHFLYDELETRPQHPLLQDFRNRLQKIASEFRERRQPRIISAWRDWFPELVCDACGALTFGPAYLVTLTRRLYSSDPYLLPTENVPVEHPPDALRYELVRSILNDRIPNQVFSLTADTRREFEHHLSITDRYRNPDYESWVDDEILSIAVEVTEMHLDSDLDQICTTIMDSSVTPEPAREMRVHANREILNLQNGG
jgi:hypothetical protein